MGLYNYMGYIKEDIDTDFKLGDIVIVSGIVDNRHFDNVKSKIVEIIKSEHLTNMNEDGLCDQYDYNGTSYRIKPEDGSDTWYVPKYNLRPVTINLEPGKIKWYKKGKFTNE